MAGRVVCGEAPSAGNRAFLIRPRRKRTDAVAKFGVFYAELAHMVFAKIEESAKRGWTGVVRGHELVPWIREGACAMEL